MPTVEELKNIAAANQTLWMFQVTGAGLTIDARLIATFPLFEGKAPAGHPYPQAYKEGATDAAFCFVETIDDMALLRRTLRSGRVISMDTDGFTMLNDGYGIAHLNMNNADNRVENLKWVTESEARELLLSFQEPSSIQEPSSKTMEDSTVPSDEEPQNME